jgi:plastocyanin
MKKNNLLGNIITILFISFTLASCSKSSGGGYSTPTPPTTPPTQPTNPTPPVTPPTTITDTVNMMSMKFIPSTVTVKKGTVVIWINKDSYGHTVTSVDGTSFNSGNVNGGSSFTYMANTVGTFNYQCNYHVSMGMVGVLTVTN